MKRTLSILIVLLMIVSAFTVMPVSAAAEDGTSKCYNCGGSGVNVCSNCGGEGWLVQYNGYNMLISRCSVCGGSGAGTCSVCSGTGKIVTSGATGSCKWELKDRELIISGKGEMANYYSDDDIPWRNHSPYIQKITVKSGVTSIGYKAFYKSAAASVTIPKSVTKIDGQAFSDCDSLKSVTLPDTLTELGYNAFSGCDSLKSVTLPKSVTSMSFGAFSHCPALENVVLSKGLTAIGSRTFNGCRSLKSFTIPSSVTSIGDGAFDDTEWYNSKPDGPIYIGKWLYKYKGEYPEKITVKSGTLRIADGAFSNFDQLESITLPDGLLSIGGDAFYGCTALKSIAIPSSVTTIGWYAFSGCSNLSKITFPNSISDVGYAAFEGTAWYNAKPDGVVYIGKTLFGCKGKCPSSVAIKSGTKSINAMAFEEHTELKSVTIPASVTSIGKYAFFGCTSMKSVTIPATVTSIEHHAFGYYYDFSMYETGKGIASTGADLNAIAETGGGDETLIKGFVIKGKRGSEAERYAKENGITFKALTTNLSKCTVSLSYTSVTYNGSKKTPTVTVKNGSKKLTKGTDFTVSYSNNTSAGTATVTVKGKGDYSGTVTKNFTIKKAAISSCTASLSYKTTAYSGAKKAPAVTVKNGSKTLKKGTDYTVSYKDNTAVGKATVTVTGKGNYSGTKTLTFTITPAKVTGLKTASKKSTSVKLGWNKTGSASGYYVYRYDSSTSKWTKIKTVASNSASVSNLKANTKYKFAVKAYKKVSGKYYLSPSYTSVTVTTAK